MINFEKKSVLNLEVSYFKNIKSVDPITVNLLNILENCEHKSLVEKLRNSNDDFEKAKIKRSIGCISPSGIFSHRNINFLVKHSGLIVFDIDLKDNLHISNYSELREEISKISNVAYVALSVSGKGYWGLIPISDAKKHKLFFKEIEKVFKSYGIVIDPSGSDVTRLRILSYDPSAYFNHNAITLSQYGAEESKKIGKITELKSFWARGCSRFRPFPWV